MIFKLGKKISKILQIAKKKKTCVHLSGNKAFYWLCNEIPRQEKKKLIKPNVSD